MGDGDYVMYQEQIPAPSHNLFLRRIPGHGGACGRSPARPTDTRGRVGTSRSGGVVAKDSEGFALLPLDINEEGP